MQGVHVDKRRRGNTNVSARCEGGCAVKEKAALKTRRVRTGRLGRKEAGDGGLKCPFGNDSV